jgi:hypothetical protein
MSGPDLFTAAAATRPAHTAAKPTGTRGNRIAFNVYEGEDVRTITPPGRVSWAIGELIAAAGKGCTPIDNPAPRWSAYVHKAKHVYRLDIVTITEMHGGDYAGKHARYVLRSKVQFADPASAAYAGGDQ